MSATAPPIQGLRERSRATRPPDTTRPIIFSAPMVRAILAGRKTQTRRLINPQPRPFILPTDDPPHRAGDLCEVALEHPDRFETWPRIRTGRVITRQAIRYHLGQHLYVREMVRAEELPDGTDVVRYQADQGTMQIPNTAEGGNEWGALMGPTPPNAEPEDFPDTGPWRSAYHAPKWTSRLHLTVTDIRIQRLQEISEADAAAEGTQEPSLSDLGGALRQAAWSERQVFHRLWNHLHGRGAWDRNPYVVALTFTANHRSAL